MPLLKFSSAASLSIEDRRFVTSTWGHRLVNSVHRCSGNQIRSPAAALAPTAVEIAPSIFRSHSVSDGSATERGNGMPELPVQRRSEKPLHGRGCQFRHRQDAGGRDVTYLTVSDTVAVCVLPPPVPVTVRV